MRVLIACEYSGVVRDAFRELGHDAWSCDLDATESDDTEHHVIGDVLPMIYANDFGLWDLMIAHPPCTYLCNSGVCWLHKREGRWEQMIEGAKFFKALLDAPIPRVAVENPIPHRYAVEQIGRKYDQIIQPWQFGHDASKATCLWLRGLPPLEPTAIIKKKRYANQTPSGRCKLGPSPDRGKIRSKTYRGIARAMANQWGRL